MRYWKPDHGQGERILELFPQLMGGRHVVSVTGAGGKTSLIWRLAEELRETGRRVIVTTTTHMAWRTEETGWRPGRKTAGLPGKRWSR